MERGRGGAATLARTIAMALPLDEAIPIFHPQLLLVY
jgi:hypothetical protein